MTGVGATGNTEQTNRVVQTEFDVGGKSDSAKPLLTAGYDGRTGTVIDAVELTLDYEMTDGAQHDAIILENTMDQDSSQAKILEALKKAVEKIQTRLDEMSADQIDQNREAEAAKKEQQAKEKDNGIWDKVVLAAGITLGVLSLGTASGVSAALIATSLALTAVQAALKEPLEKMAAKDPQGAMAINLSFGIVQAGMMLATMKFSAVKDTVEAVKAAKAIAQNTDEFVQGMTNVAMNTATKIEAATTEAERAEAMIEGIEDSMKFMDDFVAEYGQTAATDASLAEEGAGSVTGSLDDAISEVDDGLDEIDDIEQQLDDANDILDEMEQHVDDADDLLDDIDDDEDVLEDLFDEVDVPEVNSADEGLQEIEEVDDLDDIDDFADDIEDEVAKAADDPANDPNDPAQLDNADEGRLADVEKVKKAAGYVAKVAGAAKITGTVKSYLNEEEIMDLKEKVQILLARIEEIQAKMAMDRSGNETTTDLMERISESRSDAIAVLAGALELDAQTKETAAAWGDGRFMSHRS